MTAVTTDEAPVPAQGSARWSRLASTGLLMATIGPALMLIAGFVWGLDFSDDAAFFAVTLGVGLVGAFLARRAGTLPKVLGLVAAVLMVMAMWWTIFGLFSPISFFDFVPGLLVLPGALIAIVSSIAALRAQRRGDLVATPERGEARWLKVWPALVLVLAIMSAALTFLGQEDLDAADADLTVTLTDFEFDESEYSVAGGTTVLVRNDDPFLHTFTIEELDIDVTMSPGQEELVEIPAQAGDYIVFCEPHSDPDDPGKSEDDMAAGFQVN